MDTGLADRVCVVTGAGSGIGRAAAEILAAERAHVALWDSRAEAPAEVELDGPGERLDAVVDVADGAAVAAALAAVLERHGRVDALIHCAAIYTTTPFSELGREEWDRVVDVDLGGAYNVCRAVCEPMQAQGDGRIVLFGSIAARMGGLAASAAYAACKAGIGGMTRNLAQWGGPHGIRVNSVNPGFIATPMNAVLGDAGREAAIAATPLRRVATPAECARMAVILVSDIAGFVHGVELDVNGGMYLA
ncbi:MAG TPA: SDR family NAD(P)-dependent oxidoreductase [Solirubrobacterales bacterium]|nr:SDR family NAD(P)-dependent oxidoreductase [Solirubrobacterales bacterium]